MQSDARHARSNQSGGAATLALRLLCAASYRPRPSLLMDPRRSSASISDLDVRSDKETRDVQNELVAVAPYLVDQGRGRNLLPDDVAGAPGEAGDTARDNLAALALRIDDQGHGAHQ